MPSLLNKDTIEQDNNDSIFQQVMSLSPEQRRQLKTTLEAEKARLQQRQGRFFDVGRGLSTARDVFLQAGGIKPSDTTTDLNEFIMKERIRQSMEQADPLKQAQLRALRMVTGEEDTGETRFRPKGITVAGQTFERIPTEAEKETERQEKLYETVQTKELGSMAQMLPKLEQAETAVKNLETQFYKGWKPVSVGKGETGKGISERMRGAGAITASWFGTEPELRTYLRNRAAFSSLISKGGFMEAGMLTNQDIARVLNALPQPGATKEESDAAWREIKAILGSARKRFEGRVKKYTGRSISEEAIPTQTTEDFSQMTDEELQAITRGE